jgi:uncharacterized protein GlcG (DUF336 family)
VIDGRAREIIGRSENAKTAGRGDRAAANDKKGGSFMTIRCALAAGLIATCALPSQAQVITQRDVGVRMGLAVAVGALDQCEKDGNSISVAVVDRAGRLRVFLQSDQANPHNLELARRKAYTARTFGRTSAEWAKRTTEMPELAAQRELADVIALRGGVPIKVGNETIGAVGVSGSSSEGDEKCAMAGLAKVADQLK